MPLELLVHFELIVVHLRQLFLCELEFLGEGVEQDRVVVFAAAVGTLHLPVQIRVILNVHLHVDFLKSVFQNLNNIVAALLHTLNTGFVV